jgi:hypothetical protein
MSSFVPRVVVMPTYTPSPSLASAVGSKNRTKLRLGRNHDHGIPRWRPARAARPCAQLHERRLTVNWGLIITFAVVIAGAIFMAYALIRPFTHFRHDHRDVIHPPHLD